MNDEACEQHSWDTAEMCETSLGNLMSPVCKHCGAVKLELERRARDREEFNRRMAVPVKTNQPPKGAPPVHPFQTEIFMDA